MRRLMLAVAGILAASVPVGSAGAASFSCGGYLTATEKAICGNSELSNLDSQMAQAYFTALNSTV